LSLSSPKYGFGIRDPGSRGEKGTGSRIQDPDPQHWFEESPVAWSSSWRPMENRITIFDQNNNIVFNLFCKSVGQQIPGSGSGLKPILIYNMGFKIYLKTVYFVH
jgi:hypothetical protein